MKKNIIFLIIFLISFNAFSQDFISFSDRGYIEYYDNEYLFIIILVNDLNKALDIWNVPNVAPNIQHTTSVKVNDSISLFIVYSVANKDEIDLTYNLKLRNPNGTYSERIEYKGLIISNKIIQKRILYTANQLPMLIFNEEDETGKYYFQIEIFDFYDLVRVFILEFNLEQ